MIDLHIHLLPGIDDGAQSWEETVAMCRMAAAEGCAELVATPHQRTPSWNNTDRARLAELLAEAQRAVGTTPKLHLGGEIRVDSELLEALDRHPESGLNPLGESRYLLLELERDGPTSDPFELLHEVRVAGWTPILAHPEFIAPIAEDLGLARALVESGALLQVTAMSVTGEFGRRAEEVSSDLLDAGLVHFVASDAHSPRWRPPGLRRAYDTIAERWGDATAQRLTRENPRAVVENRDLAPPAR